MALFGSKKNYLGIDLGGVSIKIIELEDYKGRPKLVTYGFAEVPGEIVRNEKEENINRVANLIQEIKKRARVTTDQVVAALPSYAVFSSLISLPVMPKKELAQAVMWEAKKFVPPPIENMILDWKIINEEEIKKVENKKIKKDKKDKNSRETTENKNLKILLTAASKNIVNNYVEVFRRAKLKIVSLETESFALERSLLFNDPDTSLILDIGATATNIAVVEKGIPILNRSLDVGGESVTRAIASSLNIDQERAEQFKRDFGLSALEEVSAVPRTIEVVLNSIIHEIKYVINLYQSEADKKIEKIVLAGGSAFLLNLPQYLEKTFNIKTFIGDPWAHIIYPVELKKVLQEIGPRFAVAIGLAMREIV